MKFSFDRTKKSKRFSGSLVILNDVAGHNFNSTYKHSLLIQPYVDK